MIWLVIGIAIVAVAVGLGLWLLHRETSAGDEKVGEVYEQFFALEGQIEGLQRQVVELGHRAARIETRQDVQRTHLNVHALVIVDLLRWRHTGESTTANVHLVSDDGTTPAASGDGRNGDDIAAPLNDPDDDDDEDYDMPFPDADERPANVGGCVQ